MLELEQVGVPRRLWVGEGRAGVISIQEITLCVGAGLGYLATSMQCPLSTGVPT